MFKIIIPSVNDDLNVLFNDGLNHFYFTLFEAVIVNLRHLRNHVVFSFVTVLHDMDVNRLVVIRVKFKDEPKENKIVGILMYFDCKYRFYF